MNATTNNAANRTDELLASLIDGLSAALSSEGVKVVVVVYNQSTHIREGDMKIVQRRGKRNQITVSKLGTAR